MNVASVLAEGRRDLLIGFHNSSNPMKPSCSIVWLEMWHQTTYQPTAHNKLSLSSLSIETFLLLVKKLTREPSSRFLSFFMTCLLSRRFIMLFVDACLSGSILARQIVVPFGIFDAWQMCHVAPSVVLRSKCCHTQLVEVQDYGELLVVADDSIISIPELLVDWHCVGDLMCRAYLTGKNPPL